MPRHLHPYRFICYPRRQPRQARPGLIEAPSAGEARGLLRADSRLAGMTIAKVRRLRRPNSPEPPDPGGRPLLQVPNMSYPISLTMRRDLSRRFRGTLARSLPAYQEACGWPEVYAASRDRVVLGEFRGHTRLMDELEELKRRLTALYSGLAGPHAPLTAEEGLGATHRLFVAAYLERLDEAIWAEMQARLEATAAGRACLDHLRKMVDAEGIVLDASTPPRAGQTLAALAAPAPPVPLTARALSAAGVRLVA
jgi:hypothetical protein